MTSVLLAAYMNANRRKGARAVKPEELNPFIDEDGDRGGEGAKEVLSPKESIEVLRKVFIHGDAR